MTHRASQDRYLIERTLGRGGMATVYLAHDRTLDRPVALKVLADHFAADPAMHDRFLREARLAAKLVHSNVVQVYDVGDDERGAFIVMEYVDGDTLADELRRRGRVPAGEVVSVGIQICAALEAAHAEQLVHRDIKPQNILRRPDGEVKLADFGIARSLDGTSHTETGTVLGTAAYLAPEQARGEHVTAAADIYALGVVLYELLTGQPPFSADTLPELLLKREQGAIAPPSQLAAGIPPRLEAVVMRCLAPSPEDRPTSVAHLARELAASVDEPATEPLPKSAGPRATVVLPPTEVRRHQVGRRGPVAVALVTLLLVVAVIVGREHYGSSGANRHGAGVTTHRASTTSTKTTRTITTTGATTRPPAATPQQAIASARAAIVRAQTSGQLDPGAAKDLNHRLDDITQALAENPQDAAHRVADLRHHLGDLAGRGGQLSAAGLARISAPLNRLAVLLPAETAPPRPPDHGKGKGKDHKK